MSFSPCSHSRMFELHIVGWCTCSVWHEEDIFTITAESESFLCAHWTSDFKRRARTRDLWHHKYLGSQSGCDVETWNLRHTNTEKGLYIEVGNVWCPAVKLVKRKISSIFVYSVIFLRGAVTCQVTQSAFSFSHPSPLFSLQVPATWLISTCAVWSCCPLILSDVELANQHSEHSLSHQPMSRERIGSPPLSFSRGRRQIVEPLNSSPTLTANTSSPVLQINTSVNHEVTKNCQTLFLCLSVFSTICLLKFSCSDSLHSRALVILRSFLFDPLMLRCVVWAHSWRIIEIGPRLAVEDYR